MVLLLLMLILYLDKALLVNEEPYFEVIKVFGEQILLDDKTINRSMLRDKIIEFPTLKRN